MRRTYRSFRYAVEGLTHAMTTERNFRHFIVGYTVVVIAGFAFGIGAWEWMAVVGSGGAFMAMELINTSLERLVNALDELYKKQGREYHHALKQTKDVAAAAALVMLVACGTVLLIVFTPYVWALVQLSLHS